MQHTATVTESNGIKTYSLDGVFIIRDIEDYTHMAVFTNGDLRWVFPRKSARKYTPKGLPAGTQYQGSYPVVAA